MSFLQIVDRANVFQIPDAMKVMDAFIRSAQELLFDNSCDGGSEQVVTNSFMRSYELIVFCSV